MPPVLVTGATGRVGRAVVGLLIDTGVPVGALTHRSEVAATLPAGVEVVAGDLTVPAFITSTVFDILASAPRSFRRLQGRHERSPTAAPARQRSRRHRGGVISAP
ncbi:MAG TPA: NAD(P)H-binding protein [Candidatus Micrarchaeaceae archaeon]|nr:NAD(P)H-binding protein [Candidatus Micrarchaeaceae archaeon]